jgi:DNA uptake protein ComE-like DNA-binding protein
MSFRLIRPAFVAGVAVMVALVVGSTLAARPVAAQSAKPAAGRAAAALGAAQEKAATAKLLLDINRAASGDLEALPGIGKALAARIIGGRPYANKQQLVQKGILTQAVYDKVKDQLIAKQ